MPDSQHPVRVEVRTDEAEESSEFRAQGWRGGVHRKPECRPPHLRLRSVQDGGFLTSIGMRYPELTLRATLWRPVRGVETCGVMIRFAAGKLPRPCGLCLNSGQSMRPDFKAETPCKTRRIRRRLLRRGLLTRSCGPSWRRCWPATASKRWGHSSGCAASTRPFGRCSAFFGGEEACSGPRGGSRSTLSPMYPAAV
jgi:hypothetical protein